jgi:hypothetical protein
MCTHLTVKTPLDASAKGPNGNWFHVSDATVYFDHPVHAMADHTLNVDLWGKDGQGPGNRVALELTAASARELMIAIAMALESAPAELTA